MDHPTITELYQKRELLERILATETRLQGDCELRIYDLIVEECRKYDERLSQNIAEIMAAARKHNNIVLRRLTTNAIVNLGHRPAFIIGTNIDYKKHHMHLYDGAQVNPVSVLYKKADEIFAQRAYKDAAIIIDKQGCIIRVGVQLSKLNPELVPKQRAHCVQGIEDALRQSGNTRHTSARAAAYQMPGTVFYVLSEETGHVHRFGGTHYDQRGSITFSTLPEFEKMYRK